MATREELRKAKAKREARIEWYMETWKISKTLAGILARQEKVNPVTIVHHLSAVELEEKFGLTEGQAWILYSRVTSWIYSCFLKEASRSFPR